ncbi:MAG: chromate transporter, partial [Kiritimatiellae bacterium]|nr:chromate transporter [Kiritimatiellia bacterium]MBR1837607.1 chromate transporter [Kiritimatiellia bacterium]
MTSGVPSSKAKRLLALFCEFFKIAAFVLGGGYAILAAAEDVFARRRKWLREGELLDSLPLFQMVPGLIAGNTAIYVGRKIAGLAGSAAALAGVALPSLGVILAVARGYDALPLGDPRVQGAFLGLRAALTGISVALLASSWKRIMHGKGA